MTRLPWFRLYDEIIDDVKIMDLPVEIRWDYIEIMCCINRQNRETGRVPDIKTLVFLLRKSDTVIEAILTRLLTARLIRKDRYGYYSPSFGKRQFISDSSTDRVKRFRERSMKHTESESDKKKINKRKIFIKPTIYEIKKYAEEIEYNLDAEKFFYSYEQKNWMVGKHKMKKWKAAVSNWKKNGWGRNNEDLFPC